MEDKLVRLNKYISEAGVCSRREADRLIDAGKVIVNGKKAAMGMKVNDSMSVEVDGKLIKKEEEFILIALNKPIGIICSSKYKDNIVDYVGYEKRIYPIGRLDKDSEGLILLTNNGEISNKILKARNYHEKEYIVTVNKPITDEFIHDMSSGVEILDTVTRKCEVKKLNDTTFKIILTQGLNRQIRRMCEALGYKVTVLKRVRIMNIELGKLQPGEYRKLNEEEIKELVNLLD